MAKNNLKKKIYARGWHSSDIIDSPRENFEENRRFWVVD